MSEQQKDSHRNTSSPPNSPDPSADRHDVGPNIVPGVGDQNPGRSTVATGDGRHLEANHRDYLSARAVTAELARSKGLFSADADTLKDVLGRKDDLHCGGIVIPYLTSSGGTDYVRVRLDVETDDGARFLVPAGIPVPLYVPTDSARSSDTPLFVSEGPIKALALLEAGYTAVGLGGVSTTLDRDKHGKPALGASWIDVPVEGRSVFIAFDAGAATNPIVAHAENNLGRALVAAGADVRVIRIPLHRKGAQIVRDGGRP